MGKLTQIIQLLTHSWTLLAKIPTLKRDEKFGAEIWKLVQSDTRFQNAQVNKGDMKAYSFHLPVILDNLLDQQASDATIQVAREKLAAAYIAKSMWMAEFAGGWGNILFPEKAAEYNEERQKERLAKLEKQASSVAPIVLNSWAQNLRDNGGLTIRWLLKTDPMVFFQGVIYRP